MVTMKPIHIIVAYDQNYVIGHNNQLVYNIKKDMNHFREITSFTKNSYGQNAIIMGRKTYQSIGKELPNRLNIIVSKSMQIKGTHVFSEFNSAIDYLNSRDDIENIFIIGGSEIYTHAFQHLDIQSIFATHIFDSCNIKDQCVYFPFEYIQNYDIVSKSDIYIENGIPFQFLEYHLKTYQTRNNFIEE